VIYPAGSPARLLLDEDPDVLGRVVRWTSVILTSPRFWSLRPDWPDLTQEVLSRLVASLKEGRYDSSRDFHAYVSGIAVHTAQQALEGSARRRDHVSTDETEIARDDGAAAGDEVAMRQAVRRILDEASEDCRALMRAYFLEEKDYEAIAADLGIPIGTVKSRLSRCLDCARRSWSLVIRRPAAGSRRQPGAREIEIG
jgi:RNA polymerase sigma factor (sigma-70 family)